MEIIPEIVRKETKISVFLRTEDNNPHGAARRLYENWQARKALFGDRWLLPMTQTGAGTLSARDIELIQCACHVCLPRGDHGAVLYYDETRLPRPADASLARCAFYYGTIYAERAQDLTYIFVVNSAKRQAVNMDTERWKVYKAVLPIKLSQLLVVEAYEPFKEHWLDYMGYQTKRIAEMKTQQNVELLSASSSRGTLRLLQERGIEAAHVPISLGGTYDYNTKFPDWIRMRLSVEEVLLPSPAKCYRPSIVPQVDQLMALAGKGDLNTQTQKRVEDRKRNRPQVQQEKAGGDDQAIVLVRERNALYARRSYQKRKLELLTLEGQCQVWEARNECVRVQNAYLEKQLEMAEECIRANKCGRVIY